MILSELTLSGLGGRSASQDRDVTPWTPGDEGGDRG